ncbi:MAG: hypothetical protein AB7P24_05480 [Nitrospira sp.]
MSIFKWNKNAHKKDLRGQIKDYGLERKPFTKGLLLSALAQIEATESEAECNWENLDDAIRNSVVIVTSHITTTAMEDNELIWLMTRGVVVRQAKVHAVVAFNIYVQICLFSSLTNEDATFNRLQIFALTLRTLCIGLPEDEWNRVFPDLTQLLISTTKELAKEDHPHLAPWKTSMDTFVSAYILSFIDKSPQFQITNYRWVFAQHLAQLLNAAGR